MAVSKICRRQVEIAEASESVQSAAWRMKERCVGCVVILNASQEPVGILTDRDVVTRVVAEGKSPTDTLVGDCMTLLPKTVEEATAIEDAISVMRCGCFRRLPVVDGRRKLVGIVTLDDLLRQLSQELVWIGDVLKSESRVVKDAQGVPEQKH